jgi:hypothetical protein
LFEQSGFLEKFDACFAALLAGAAVDVPNSKLFVSGGNGIDELRFGFGQ